MNCENCNNEHDGSYGSGRFCSCKCSRGFSTKAKRKEINDKVSKKMQGNIPWHKGKINVYSEKTKKLRSESIKSYFIDNPGEQTRRLLGHKVSDKTKQKLSFLAIKNGLGGYTKGGGRGKHGWYKGYWCDSSWELAWVIYHLDNNIFFERNTKGFEYIFKNKKYKFYPDFIKDNIYFEIKGWIDEKNKEKINQFPFKLEVLTKKEIKNIIEYVKSKYGNNFISLYNLNGTISVSG